MTLRLAAHEINNTTVREVERGSIRAFVESCAPLYQGLSVLDYGCGQRPYEDIVVREGGTYTPWDRSSFPANVSVDDVGEGDPLRPYQRWDVILCNQVIQYVPRPHLWLIALRFALRPGGHLILTGPTNWAEVETADLHRFTTEGITRLIRDAGFILERVETRAVLELGGFNLPLGWGVVARVR